MNEDLLIGNEIAERAVLGAMLNNAASIGKAVSALRSEDFTIPAHATLFSLLTDLYLSGSPTDVQTVASTARQRNLFPGSAIAPAMFDLYQQAATTGEVDVVIRHVQDNAHRRAMTVALTRALQRASTPTDDVPSLIATITDDVAKAGASRLVGSTMDIGQALQAAIARAKGLTDGSISRTGLLTGFPDLDAITHGLQPGQLVLVAARPGLGKSVFALDLARHAAVQHNVPVYFVSLEMSPEEIGQRMAAASASVPLDRITGGQLTASDITALNAAFLEVGAAPLVIETQSSLTTADIHARAATLAVRPEGLGLIVVDYLGLLRHQQEARVENRQVMIADISRDLKLLAKELGVPVIALSQLNRGVELRADKKPLLADLRDSGALEQDADLVLLLHREDAYQSDSPRAGEVDVLVAKHRQGRLGTVTLVNQYHYARLGSMFHS